MKMKIHSLNLSILRRYYYSLKWLFESIGDVELHTSADLAGMIMTAHIGDMMILGIFSSCSGVPSLSCMAATLCSFKLSSVLFIVSTFSTKPTIVRYTC